MPKQKNPSPRLGRGLTFDRPFKPSKKFEKQFPQAAKRREAAKVKPRFKSLTRLYDLWSPHVDTFFERLEQLKDFKPQQIELPRGNLFDRIAVLANLVGGIDDAAEILDLDAELLINLFLGGKLNRLQDDELNEQYSHLARSEEDQELYDVDIEEVERHGSILTDAIISIERTTSDKTDGDIFRQAIAEGDVDLDKLDKGQLLFKNLTSNQLQKIFDKWVEDKEAGVTSKVNLDEMFDVFANDDYDFWDIEESEFWAWFRELFYS